MNKRKYLTYYEITQLLQASRSGTHAERDECLIQMCFIHGFRVSEICHLKFSDVDLGAKVIHVHRLKNGLSTTQPLIPLEINLLERWFKVREKWRCSPDTDWVFLSQKGGKMSRQQVYSLLRRYGQLAKISLALHPHMLRHACGYELANKGLDTRLIQDYLGHRNIRHTVVYTASNASRFNGVWQGE